MSDAADILVDSGLGYCRLHHGIIECDSWGERCDNAADDLTDPDVDLDPFDGEPRPCDPTELLYVARVVDPQANATGTK